MPHVLDSIQQTYTRLPIIYLSNNHFYASYIHTGTSITAIAANTRNNPEKETVCLSIAHPRTLSVKWSCKRSHKMHVRTYSLTLFISARDKLNKRANSHLLPVLLQRRHRGEVARVVHQLKFLKNTVIRQHVHVDARKQESKLLWSSNVIGFFLSPLPNAQECFKSSAKCNVTLKADGFSNANALCKKRKRKRKKIKKILVT